MATKLPPNDLYPDPNDAIRWQCTNGHAFAASYNEVEAGAGCPVCEVERLREYISQAVIAIQDYEDDRRDERVLNILETALLPPPESE
jgi:hypothetical protein